MSERLYVPCWCYCPFCRRRCQGCVPLDVVEEAAALSARKDPNGKRYANGHRATLMITSRYLPKVECDDCCRARVGPAAYAVCKGIEDAKLARSKEMGA